ncbi:MAG: hypothetical protein R2824_33410 [Saprospiraceae bacterium]|nr:hypothetical protein [Lewinella sp.]
MKEIEDIKQELHELLENDQLKPALKMIRDILNEDVKRQHQQLIINTFRRLKVSANEKRLGEITREEFNVEQSNITGIILDLIDKLTTDDISELDVFLQENYTPIMVISDTSTGVAKMKQFFNQFYFKLVEYHAGKVPLSKDRLSQFTIIILDAMYIEGNRMRYLNHLEDHYLQHEGLFFLYFGKRHTTFEEPEYAHKLHFSNSVFSLYARINEMMDYLRLYRTDKTLPKTDDHV